MKCHTKHTNNHHTHPRTPSAWPPLTPHRRRRFPPRIRTALRRGRCAPARYAVWRRRSPPTPNNDSACPAPFCRSCATQSSAVGRRAPNRRSWPHRQRARPAASAALRSPADLWIKQLRRLDSGKRNWSSGHFVRSKQFQHENQTEWYIVSPACQMCCFVSGVLNEIEFIHDVQTHARWMRSIVEWFDRYCKQNKNQTPQKWFVWSFDCHFALA